MISYVVLGVKRIVGMKEPTFFLVSEENARDQNDMIALDAPKEPEIDYVIVMKREQAERLGWLKKAKPAPWKEPKPLNQFKQTSSKSPAATSQAKLKNIVAPPFVEEVKRCIALLDVGKGAPWEEICKEMNGINPQATSKKNEEIVEEALNYLMDQGVVYEPILGRLRLT